MRMTAGLRITMAAAGLLTAATLALPAMAGPTLDAVRAKGFIQCGVNTGVAGFSAPDKQGNWSGIDVDLCRGIAAAVFGDSTRIRYTPTTAQQRFVALQSGEIDVLTRNATQTLMRDVSLGLREAGVNFYACQGFIVNKSLGWKSARDLSGSTICVQPCSTTELNLSDYFRKNHMTFRTVVIEKVEENIAAFASGRCDVYTTDATQLAAIRASALPK